MPGLGFSSATFEAGSGGMQSKRMTPEQIQSRLDLSILQIEDCALNTQTEDLALGKLAAITSIS